MSDKFGYKPYGEEWKKEVSKLKKEVIVDMLAKKGNEVNELREIIAQLKINLKQKL